MNLTTKFSVKKPPEGHMMICIKNLLICVCEYDL